jgi:hypothetical protein
MSKSHSPFSLVEKLETRTLFSASPVDLAGQYVGGQNNVAYEVNLRQSATVKTSYTGDFLIAGADLKLAGAESSTSMLKGSITQLTGKSTSFTATLKGNVLTFASGGQTALLAKISSTPASPLPTMYAGKGKYFSYEAPKGWKVAEVANQSGEGIAFASPDASEEATIIGVASAGYSGTSAITGPEAKGGYNFINRVQLVNTAYEQQEVDLITYTSKGTAVEFGQVVTTLFNPSTDQTETLLAVVEAPKAKFAADALTLCDMLQSVRPV